MKAINYSKQKNKDKIIILSIMSIVSISLVFSENEVIKYIKYCAPLVSFLFLIVVKKINIHKQVIPFFFILVVSLFNVSSIAIDGWKDFLFILSYALLFFPVSKYCANVNIVHINYLMFLAFVVEMLLSSKQIGNFNFEESSSVFEDSVFGFVFGLFFIYSFINKNKYLMLLNIIFIFVSLKRIAVFGVLAAILFLFISKKVSIIRNPVVLTVANLLFVYFLVCFANGQFDDLLFYLFDKRSSEFSLGRFDLYQDVVESIYKEPLKLLGNGLGTSYSYGLFGIRYNLHSDILKLFYEFGFVVFSIFFYIFYLTTDRAIIAYAIYMNVVFITDNVLIYMPVMYTFLLLSILESNKIHNKHA